MSDTGPYDLQVQIAITIFRLKFLKFKYTGYSLNVNAGDVIGLPSKKNHKPQFPKGICFKYETPVHSQYMSSYKY